MGLFAERTFLAWGAVLREHTRKSLSGCNFKCMSGFPGFAVAGRGWGGGGWERRHPHSSRVLQTRPVVSLADHSMGLRRAVLFCGSLSCNEKPGENRKGSA